MRDLCPADATDCEAVDAALDVLDAKKAEWLQLPFARRLRLLGEMHDILRTGIDHEEWAADSLAAMGLPRPCEVPLAVEMVTNTSYMAGDLESLIDTYAALAHTDAPPAVPVRRLASGQAVADVYPRAWNGFDGKGPQAGWTVELRLAAGGAVEQGRALRAVRQAGDAAVELVLAAGNQGFLGLTDALYALFVRQHTVLLKHHPVRAYNHKWCERLFAPLIRDGYLRSCVVGLTASRYAAGQARVHHIHITGGKATHDALVWGEGTEAEVAARRRSGTPALAKPVTSELGCVTPWIVAPGAYGDAALAHQAAHLATSLCHNNSANCCAPKLLLVQAAWPERPRFLAALRAALRQSPHPPPYYPGQRARFDAVALRHQGEPGFEQIRSDVPAPASFGPLGAPLPWTLIEIPDAQARRPLGAPEAHPFLQAEPFCPVLAICAVEDDGTLAGFLAAATKLCNDSVMGTLSCTLVVRDEDREGPAVRRAVAELRYGTVGVNVWTGTCNRFATAAWGAFPGETLDRVTSGIGMVRNHLLFDAPEKTVVWTPLMSPGHIGTGDAPTLDLARALCAQLTGNVDTARANAGNPICQGNFRPLSAEGAHGELEVTGRLPPELDGMYLRNGVNPRWPPAGRMHMFDGEAMLHCVRLKGGRAVAYANTWLRATRYRLNEAAGRELYATFGDLAMGGMDVAVKLHQEGLKQKTGAVPWLPDRERAHPSTNILLVGPRLFGVTESILPFEVHVDPETGVALSGGFEDFGGSVAGFSAHPRVCPKTGELHCLHLMRPVAGWSPAGPVPVLGPPTAMHYVFDRDGRLVHRLPFTLRTPQPAFLHDYVLTESYVVVVDHSVRIDRGRLPRAGLFTFREDMPLRFGLIPRRARTEAEIRWFDTGRPANVWHVAAGWEERAGQGKAGSVVLWLPVFDRYPDDLPIHLAEEPPSFLRRFVLDLESGRVAESRVAPGLEVLPGERCDVNRGRFGQKQRWVYLMKRCPGREMYDGFVKYDLAEECVRAVVDYGDGRFGGEALFVAKADGAHEDDGWLMDIVYDERRDASELCIWDAATLGPGPAAEIARVRLPHRVPYGVHATWIDAAQLARQWAGRSGAAASSGDP